MVVVCFLDEGVGGDFFVFLFGACEIRRVMEVCEGPVKVYGVDLVPFYGDLFVDV